MGSRCCSSPGRPGEDAASTCPCGRICARSRYVRDEDAVLARGRGRSMEDAEAAAHFELAQHLRETGKQEAAVKQFREAHRLQPDNWTYKRQAWSLADPTQGPTDLYEGD